MLSRQIVHARVLAVAASLEWVVRTIHEDREAWLLAADEQTLIDVEFWAPRACVVLTTSVAEVPQASRDAVYELLLQYNYLWAETGGVRMALDGLPGQIVALLEVGADEILSAAFETALGNLCIIRQAWADILQELDMEGGATPAPSVAQVSIDEAFNALRP